MTELAPLTTEPLPVRLRVDDYLLLDEIGAFAAYGKTELIEGAIVYMNSQHRPHARIKSRLFRLLAEALEGREPRMEAIVEGSVSMPPHNVPEPDIAVTREPEGSGLIPLASLALIVEVADTTLRNDLVRKALIYAREGVPEYWVVDVNGSVVHQLWSPSADAYRDRRQVAFGEELVAATIPAVRIATASL